MRSAIRYEPREKVMAGEGVNKLVLCFVKPQSLQSPTYNRQMSHFNLTFNSMQMKRQAGKMTGVMKS
jgi:hypothetical protein